VSDSILPIDTTRPCRRAIEEAARLAEELNVGLVLMYVLEPSKPTPLDGMVMAHASKLQQDRLSDLVRDYGLPPDRVRCEVHKGSPAKEIARRAHDDDTIVLGRRRRSGWRSLLRRSTAAAVVRRARCEVVVVPER
jgi:nucleotide-binding universal stress UspA family protein